MEQKHFPMLREYERMKENILNNDLGDDAEQSQQYNTINVLQQNAQKRSELMNFIRTANGKKLYVKDALKDRPSLESQSTKLMKARQKTLYRGFNGQPLHKVNNLHDFKPASKAQAR